MEQLFKVNVFSLLFIHSFTHMIATSLYCGYINALHSYGQHDSMALMSQTQRITRIAGLKTPNTTTWTLLVDANHYQQQQTEFYHHFPSSLSEIKK